MGMGKMRWREDVDKEAKEKMGKEANGAAKSMSTESFSAQSKTLGLTGHKTIDV